METAVILLISGAINLLCFIFGAKVGQAVNKGESIDLPIKSPATIIQERREKKAAKEEQNKLDIILSNIEAYNGTAQGQEDVPKG